VLVSLQHHAFDRPDLVLVGFLDGSWPAFEQSLRAGLACERDAGGGDAGDVRAAAIAFRRARGLVAGDDLSAWLAERHLSRDDLRAHLRRRVLREHDEVALAGILARHPVSVDDVAGVVDVEAACDGIVGRCATTVVGWAAAASEPGLGATSAIADGDASRIAGLAVEFAGSGVSRALGDEHLDVSARLSRLLALEAAHRWLATRVSGEAAIRACLDKHRLGWLRFRGAELRFASKDACHEGVMCLREDGLDPREVARLAGAELTEWSVLLDEAPAALVSLLVSAHPGDVVGPLPEPDGTSRLLAVTARVAPSPVDPELRGRARAELVATALEPLVAGMARWHEPL
jgi:hypothetical protein